MLTQSLAQIISDCWRDFNAFNQPYKVYPSIPILWFGDLKSYMDSARKIVSVALNPSASEFESEKGFSIQERFPHFSMPFNPVNYFEAMNDYFETNPYWGKWFQYPERILNCLKASYKKGTQSTAVHIDLFAPIATAPHWNSLSKDERGILCSAFHGYFSRMMKELNPDIILASLNSEVITSCFKTKDGRPCCPKNAYKKWSPNNKKGFFLRQYLLPDNRKLITGRNMSGTAFGGLSVSECQEGMSVIYP
jgi:hypothetical protein